MGRGLLVGLEVGSQWLVGWEALVFEGLTMESGSHVHSPKPDWQQPTEAGPGHGHQRPFFFFFFSRQSNLTTPETFKMGALSKVPFVDLLVKPRQGLASGLHPRLLLSILFILSLAGHLPP